MFSLNEIKIFRRKQIPPIEISLKCFNFNFKTVRYFYVKKELKLCFEKI